ncbi:MAG: hypothetical protein O2875_05200, partial [Planctomycetota bacterium]|nr:hypothetical protein [Planctomycetota bacterium]
MNQIRLFLCVSIWLALLFLCGCSTTNFTSLVAASQKMDEQVVTWKKTFQSSTPVEQVKIRNQIIAGRRKELIWAQRMNVRS